LLTAVWARDNSDVQIAPRGLVDQSKITAGVRRAERALAPEVVHIRHTFALDWTGEQSLFFRILLSDAASAPSKLRQTTQRIEAKILAEIKADELGLLTYFNYRSNAEQAKLRDPIWD
jgi:hypothetical protein